MATFCQRSVTFSNTVLILLFPLRGKTTFAPRWGVGGASAAEIKAIFQQISVKQAACIMHLALLQVPGNEGLGSYFRIFVFIDAEPYRLLKRVVNERPYKIA